MNDLYLKVIALNSRYILRNTAYLNYIPTNEQQQEQQTRFSAHSN